MLQAGQVISMLSQLAPNALAYEWDNVGLQVGDLNQKIENVLLTLDINQKIVEEALSKNCQLIVSHHPLIFNSLDSIQNQTTTGKIIFEAVKNDLILYSAHTNLDQAEGGLNDYLADLLEIRDTSILETHKQFRYYKLVTFIPESALTRVKRAVLNSGAGHIGNYSETSFVTEGEGSFKPLSGTNPHQGEIGEQAQVREYRLETVVPEKLRKQVINSLLEAHPYEEVAYDLYSLENEGESIGLGRIGVLKKAQSLSVFLKNIKENLGIDNLKVAAPGEKHTVKKVALCSGSGADFIKKAHYAGADLYLTSDVDYHEAQLAEELGLILVDGGHYETEVIVKDLLYQYFQDQVEEKNLEVEFYKSEINTNPWQYF